MYYLIKVKQMELKVLAEAVMFQNQCTFNKSILHRGLHHLKSE